MVVRVLRSQSGRIHSPQSTQVGLLGLTWLGQGTKVPYRVLMARPARFRRLNRSVPFPATRAVAYPALRARTTSDRLSQLARTRAQLPQAARDTVFQAWVYVQARFPLRAS